MAITAVQDRSVVDLATLKAHLGISAATYDALLTLWLIAAKRAADEYCGHPHLERNADFDASYAIDADSNPFWADPEVELAIPAPVELGVLEYCTWHWSKRGRPANITEEKAGDLSRKYSVFATVPDMTAYIQATYWQAYRLPVWG